MPLLPLYGHTALRDRFRAAVANGSLPSSLLLQGPRGVGKQQLALWVARLLLCENADRAPCGTCRSCRMANAVQHPDLHWFFPRPRPKDSSLDPDDAREDMAEATVERDHAIAEHLSCEWLRATGRAERGELHRAAAYLVRTTAR